MNVLLDSVASFQPCQIDRPFFLNTIPKAGTMLCRNTILHFTGVQGIHEFFWPDNFDRKINDISNDAMHVGHLPFDFHRSIALKSWRKVLLVRHPAELLLAQCRSCVDPAHTAPGMVAIRECGLPLEAIMSAMIDGWEFAGIRHGAFEHSYLSYAGWASLADVILIDHRHLRDEPAVLRLLSRLGVSIPDDASARITAGQKTGFSTTYSARPVDYAHLLNVAEDLVAIHAPRALAWYDRATARPERWL